ncbi:hypothetical protein TSAR_007661 [Trichomalopsis sarcophagae]|uniref:Uncharacterized protein n=1 Tax=Trichomalopsis sarcophagae TaxID=543379 RepID=A0A232FEB0_9HYME|nr:hypothetical protein TSAR_007661 [Trichomalopsis sarcophagae]
MAVRHNCNHLTFGFCWSITFNETFIMTSKSNIPSTPTSPVSDLANSLNEQMHIKSPSPTQKRRKITIKRRLNQICEQVSKIKLSPLPQQQPQEKIIDKDALAMFCQATTVKKGSKRALTLPETLAPPSRNIPTRRIRQGVWNIPYRVSGYVPFLEVLWVLAFGSVSLSVG